MKKILIVEDEVGIAIMEKNYLVKNGFEVEIAHDGAKALEMLESFDFSLVILDLMIPKISGEEVLKQIRAESNLPVILVTAKVDEKDVLKGFRYGADDYIKKPFSGLELVERVKAVLRRVLGDESNNIIESKDKMIKFDFENYRLLKNDEEVSLTRNELLIINTLFSHPNKTFTRNEIIELSFGYDYDAFDRAIDTHIKNIRQKIEDDPKNPKYIKTVYGLGYKAGEIDEVK
ncbi:MAG: response regulator transcription factor [Tissierellia bacterium]|nr:response regulator transcription factor [Tissierellia bacterium]